MARRDKDVDDYLSHVLRSGSSFSLVPRNNFQLDRNFEKDGFPSISADNRMITNRIEKVFDGCTFINCHFHF